MHANKIPVLRLDDDELLGYVANEQGSWAAETIFGYVIARHETQQAAEQKVRTEGLSILKGTWRYQDEDHEWYPCVIKEAYENRVVVVRTNELGFQDAKIYKMVTLKNPSDNVLLKA